MLGEKKKPRASLHSCWIMPCIPWEAWTVHSLGWKEGRTIECLWIFFFFFVQIVHVLDVYIVVCMLRSTTWLLPFNEMDKIGHGSKVIPWIENSLGDTVVFQTIQMLIQISPPPPRPPSVFCRLSTKPSVPDRNALSDTGHYGRTFVLSYIYK